MTLFLFNFFMLINFYPKWLIKKINIKILELILRKGKHIPVKFFYQIKAYNIVIPTEIITKLDDDQLLSIIEAKCQLPYLSWLMVATSNPIVIEKYIENELDLTNVEHIKLDYFSCLHWMVTKNFDTKLNLALIARNKYFNDLPLYDHEIKTFMYFVNSKIIDNLDNNELINKYLAYWDIFGFRNGISVTVYSWFSMLQIINQKESLLNVVSNSNFTYVFFNFLTQQSKNNQELFWTHIIRFDENLMLDSVVKNSFFDFLAASEFKIGYDLFVSINNSSFVIEEEIIKRNFQKLSPVPLINIKSYVLPYGEKTIFHFLNKQDIESYIKNDYNKYNKPLKKWLLNRQNNRFFFYYLYLLNMLKETGFESDSILTYLDTTFIETNFIQKYLIFPKNLLSLIENFSAAKKNTVLQELYSSDEVLLKLEEKIFFLNFYNINLKNDLKKVKNYQDLKSLIDRVYDQINLKKYETMPLVQDPVVNLLNSKSLKYFIPNNKAELVKIGISMKNCIGSYYEKIYLKQCYVAVIFIDELKVLIEFDKVLQVKQMKLTANRDVPTDLRDKVLSLLDESKSTSS